MENKFVLLNLAHTGRCPRRPEGAAARILGIFSSVDNLSRHALEHYSDTVDLICVPLRKWAAVLHNVDSNRDELAHLESLAKRNKEAALNHEAEFRENVQQKRAGEIGESSMVKSKLAPPSELSGDSQVTQLDNLVEAPGVPRVAELRQQNFAVISILPDLDGDDLASQEPALLVWDAFESEEAARLAIKDSLAMIARDVHLDVLTMYEWFPLGGLDMAGVQEEFRDASLSDIMRTRKTEGKRVEEYRNLCEQRGQDPSVLDITSDIGDLRLPEPLEKQETIPNLPNLSDEKVPSDVVRGYEPQLASLEEDRSLLEIARG